MLLLSFNFYDIILSAHPAFPLIAVLGGQFTLRSNWKTYCDEFALTLHTYRSRLSFSHKDSQQQQIAMDPINRFNGLPLTHFERKFLSVDVPVYQLQSNLGTRNLQERQVFLDGLSLASDESLRANHPQEIEQFSQRVYAPFVGK